MNRSRGPRVGPWDHLLGFLICATYIGVLLAGSPDLGMSRDESFYVIAGQDYAGWFQLLAEDSSAAMEQEAIDRAWDYNHEHPGLIKSLFAISWLVQQKWEVFPDHSTAFRFPGMACAGLLLWLIYIFGARAFGRQAGLFAALAYALMPRPFYHAHLDCFDVPITLMVTFATYAYWRALRSRTWAIGFGVAFGLALATKHNAWVLPGIFLIHFVWMSLSNRSRPANARLSTRPWWLLSLSLIGPLIFVGTWPWLWNETLPRLGWYIRFHTGHEYYNIAYLGETWFRPPFPVHYPFVMTLFTVSIVTLGLCFFGLAHRLRAAVPARLTKRFWKKGASPDPSHTDVLLIGSLLAPMVVIALPSSPIFGATKHWMPSYPFLALYAGLGFWHLTERLKDWMRSRATLSRMQESAAVVLLAAALIAPSAADTIRSHPFGLSHYTFAAGGVPGAADLGMNRQFWGFTTGSLVDFFKEEMPDGGTVWLCDTTDIAWRMLQRDELIPANIRGTYNMARADFIMVHHEEHFAEVDAQAWVAFGSPAPAYVLTYDGVPIVSVYENPRRREQ
ncbi:MAG: ArnT family glycosyltransferase [Polyangiales bacterium]